MISSAAISAMVVGLGAGLVSRAAWWRLGRLPGPVSPAVPDDYDGLRYREVAAEPGSDWQVPLLAAGLAAVAGGVLGWRSGWLLPLLGLGTVLGWVDHRIRLLPKQLVVPLYWLSVPIAGLVWRAEGMPGLTVMLAGWALLGGTYGLLWLIAPASMGYGDVRLAGVLGLTLGAFGWAELITGWLLGPLVFSWSYLALAVVRRDASVLRSRAAYGPALLAGAYLGILAGPRLMA